MINANEARIAVLKEKKKENSDYMQEKRVFWQKAYLEDLKFLIEEKTNHAIKQKETWESCALNESDIVNHYLSKEDCFTTIKSFLENLGYKVIIKDKETTHPLIKWSW